MAFGSPLCTNTDALRIAYGRDSATDVSGSIVTDAISDATDEVYTLYGASEKTKIYITANHTEYEFRKVNLKTYRIESVNILNPSTNSRNDTTGSQYTATLQTNKIVISTENASKWAGSYMEFDYIPLDWHLLAKNKAGLNLLDSDESQMNPGENENESPRVSRIAKRISRIQGNLNPVACQGSIESQDYDVRDHERIDQDRFQSNPRY